MRWAIVVGGIVENIVLWDGGSSWSPPNGSTPVPIIDGQACGIGWEWNGKDFVEPEEP